MKQFRKNRCLRAAAIVIIVTAALYFPLPRAAADSEKHEIESTLNHIFQERAEMLLHPQSEAVNNYYLPDKSSQMALEHERFRAEYVTSWADKRTIKLTSSESGIRIIRQSIIGDMARISLVQSHKVGYVYINKVTMPEQVFGVGTRHSLTLKKDNGAWKIAREWYLDPLDEDPRKIAEGPERAASSPKAKLEPGDGKKYKRKRAVQYAHKYAGAAWGAGNQHHYNQKYLDYTSKGGDCTNFASQVIGDQEEGGGLPIAGGWRYFANSGGTQTWVQTDAFSNFLIRSGYGKLIAKGDYQHIATPSPKHPEGAIAELQPGDLIGYILRHDDTDHFSIVVGFDDRGYPLVDSHTADRYRVPFDLGWDRNTKYQLFHIRD
ncbi:amidase domain-containing protein [Paenibacillus sp. HW567]|uniref:amidase domain-containing protein n=1 Tax=Paenibacillus sp. HW567 TaxID=1034769 RepID=UPI00037927D4|nr:amidase domain-containing protein [Paenibacillus sp. HW567]